MTNISITAMAVNVGDRVRIERNETRYPSKGTWPQFCGRVGALIEINVDQKRPHLTEYGVAFGKVSARSNNGSLRASNVAWFQVYEICALAAERYAEPLMPPNAWHGARELLNGQKLGAT